MLAAVVRGSGSVASITIPGGRSLRPVENKARGGSFDKVALQIKTPHIFTGQTTPLAKLLPPNFLLPPILYLHLQQNFPLFFTSPLFFHFPP